MGGEHSDLSANTKLRQVRSGASRAGEPLCKDCQPLARSARRHAQLISGVAVAVRLESSRAAAIPRARSAST